MAARCGKLPRISTNYAQHRADTGRLSSGMDKSDADKGKRERVAQVQNIPKKIRDAFVPDPGFIMIGGDWSAIQWCILMLEAAKINEPRNYHRGLLARFAAGDLDPHSFLASRFEGVPEPNVTTAARQNAKSYTYGRAFAGSHRTLAREAGHTEALARKICTAHDEAFKLKPWWDRTLVEVKRRRYVQTPLGWRRYFWEWKAKPTEVFGTIIQAIEADVCKETLGIAARTKPEAFEILTTTHDSILIQVPARVEAEGLSWLKLLMEHPIVWYDGFSFPAECRSGRNWKEVS